MEVVQLVVLRPQRDQPEERRQAERLRVVQLVVVDQKVKVPREQPERRRLQEQRQQLAVGTQAVEFVAEQVVEFPVDIVAGQAREQQLVEPVEWVPARPVQLAWAALPEPRVANH
jgi:hypothetical protein